MAINILYRRPPPEKSECYNCPLATDMRGYYRELPFKAHFTSCSEAHRRAGKQRPLAFLPYQDVQCQERCQFPTPECQECALWLPWQEGWETRAEFACMSRTSERCEFNQLIKTMLVNPLQALEKEHE